MNSVLVPCLAQREVWMWPMGCSLPSGDPDVLCQHLEPAVLFLLCDTARSVCV